MLKEANICQVAIVSNDAKVLRNWYCRMFGFLPANRTVFFGPLATRVQGVPKDLNFCYWAIDGKSQFQLEFFNFISPNVTPKPTDWKPYDHGYNVIGIHCVDFEQAISRLKSSNAKFVSDTVGGIGNRWVMVIDPDGNHLEITESDVLEKQSKLYPEIPATVRYVRMSVPDIVQAQELWKSAFGLTEISTNSFPEFHDQILFSEEMPEYQQVSLRGIGLLLDIRQYTVPNPKARLASHNVTDQGIMNVAIGANSVKQWDQYYNNALDQQCSANGKPLDVGIFKVMYVNEPSKENIEILYPREWAYSITGFKPSGVFARGEIEISASTDKVWSILTDHDKAGEWSFFTSQLTKEGDSDKNGLNAVRKIGLFGLSFEETIKSWLPEQSYCYELESDWLIRNHRGMLHLSKTSLGVKVIWTISFSSTLPGLGKLTSLFLSFNIKKSLNNLKVISER